MRTTENLEIVKRRGFRLPLEAMLEIAYDPNVPEERRDKFLLACASYLHPRPQTPLMAEVAARGLLANSTSLAGSPPFANGSDAMDFLEEHARRTAAKAERSGK